VLEQDGGKNWKAALTERTAGDSAASLVPRDLHKHPVFAAMFGAESSFFGTVHVFLGLDPQTAYVCLCDFGHYTSCAQVCLVSFAGHS
jgi:hypothetical protein